MIGKVSLEMVMDTENYKLETTEFTFKGKGYLIKHEDEVVGCVCGFKESDDTFYIEEMEIVESHRGKGIGNLAVLAMKDYFKVKRVTGISLSSSISFWGGLCARFHDTCETCSYDGCIHNKDFVASDDEVYDEEYCDDFSENHFVLEF